MKTAMQELIGRLEKDIKFINEDYCKEDRYYRAGLMFALVLIRDNLEKEKQQHEKIAIDMVNICLNNINNPDCKMEDEFNKYYNETFKND